ncbi:AlbA family DNA-binding domain-containing protein [Bacillus wiedmannii]|uniref:AlbA family DNA-binding domain-containing protein n=1 Tax=Bacillus wiedmannii TaxID=1890302 RepID=UPI000BF343AF|nr:ATP-binding protein [Bacillus wiedmannii]PGB61164.1 AAA family ATPase [Bacillus wiedmannii]
MITNTYSPFTNEHGKPKTIFEIEFSDLKQIQDKGIEEGPYIEFKREFSDSIKRKLPNFITSFANERGGWFFIGIDEDNMEISCIERQEYELTINNILKSNTSPVPNIITRFLSPADDPNKGVFIIFIPEGDNPPYISKGKIYRRVGSGSSPIAEIDDRYYLDRLYNKSEINKKNIKEFCTNEISISNTTYSNMGLRHDRGMCSIYLIPKFKFDLLDSFESHNPDNIPAKQFINLALDISKTSHEYPLTQDSGHISLSMPFEKASFSHESIIFRNSKMLDNYQNTIAWEQFLGGSAKFHIPLPYLESKECIDNILIHAIDYKDKEIFDDFRFINGTSFVGALIGCLSIYSKTVRNLNPTNSELIIAFELNNVQQDVLFFDTPYFYEKIVQNGLVFSDRDNYFFNKDFLSTDISLSNATEYFYLISELFNAFGWSALEALQLFFENAQDSKK